MFFFKFYDTKNKIYRIIKNTDILTISQYTDTKNYYIKYNCDPSRKGIFDVKFDTNAESIDGFLEAQMHYLPHCI